MNHNDNTSKRPPIWAVIPAAGIGRRMGSSTPKQYLMLKGKSIIEHSVACLCQCEAVKGVVVGIAENDNYWHKLDIKNNTLLGTYTGGAQRIHTVLNGLNHLSQWTGQDDWVMVHDAVRPCLGKADIDLLVHAAMQLNSSAILASAITDTVKKVNAHAQIRDTLNRDELMLAMTPQLFPFELLHRALSNAIRKNILSTDESAAVELLGEKPLAVKGSRSNLKITTSDDLPLANFILEQLN